MKYTLLIIFLFSFFQAKSQTSLFPKHSIILDIGGIGGYGSLNYERTFFSKKKYFVSGEIGFSFFRFKDFERKFNPDLMFPIHVQTGIKWRSHHAILGIGQTLSSIVKASGNFDGKIRKNRWNGSFTTGYRFQKEGRPFMFQIFYSPLFERYERFRHWGGMSFGYSFY